MMVRLLDRIWVRFGLAVAVAIAVTLAVLTTSLLLFWKLEEARFYRTLPAEVRVEYDQLVAQGLDEGPRAMQIYGEYWRGDPWGSERFALLFALMLGLPFGLATGFWVSRLVTQPLASMAEAATRVAVGDFAVRAEGGHARGEMAEMVRDFNHMIDSLEALDRERRMTVASLSHELRTPLAVLSARLHAIVDGVIPGSDEEMKGLLQQSLHLGRLVTDLHTISLVSAGRLSLHSERLDLANLVQEELARFDTRLQEKGFEVDIQLPADAVPVRADLNRMRQIVGNLLENCLRYAVSGRWIGVVLTTRDGQVTLEFSDAGPGLPDTMRERPFQRFPNQPGGRHNGSGLGLSIVQSLVELQGGRVEVGTSARGGACIRIHFALVAEGADVA
ncbi:sensor histidine kinase [Comamonas sp. GB3 AK4-5]|uniref:sensor histidine kinase n=1 Tax=Comamonas sp. GB3 AK4-5 TaxID=3231487 RepID=UPI00351EFCF9